MGVLPRTSLRSCAHGGDVGRPSSVIGYVPRATIHAARSTVNVLRERERERFTVNESAAEIRERVRVRVIAGGAVGGLDHERFAMLPPVARQWIRHSQNGSGLGIRSRGRAKKVVGFGSQVENRVIGRVVADRPVLLARTSCSDVNRSRQSIQPMVPGFGFGS